MSKLARKFEARSRCVARADNGDHRLHQGPPGAADTEQRRRILATGEAGRIAVLFGRQQLHALPQAGVELGFGFVDRADAADPGRAAAARQLRQSIERGAGGAKMVEQRPECSRADIVGADQPQAIAPLGVGELLPRADGVHVIPLEEEARMEQPEDAGKRARYVRATSRTSS